MSEVVVKMLTIADVSESLQVTTRTIEKWVAAGKFPAPVTIGPRAKRWHPSVLDAYRSPPAYPVAETFKKHEPTIEEAMQFFGPEPQDEQLIGRELAEEMLCLSTLELFREINEGRLVATILDDRRRRFKLRDLNAYRNAHFFEIARRRAALEREARAAHEPA